jgi:hypothetical protein
VLEGALDVQAGAVGPGNEPGGGDIDDDAGQGGAQNQAAGYLGRGQQPPDAPSQNQAVSSHKVMPLAWADRISTRFSP